MSEKSKADKGKEPKQSRKNGLLYGCGTLLLLLVVAAAGIAPLFRPLSRTHERKIVAIPSGASVSRIGEELERNGVIRSGWAFGIYVRWNSRTEKLKSGRFFLSGDMSLAQIVQELEAGGRRSDDDRLRITIPEGFTLRQIARRLDEKGIVREADFLKEATTPESIAQLHADFPLPERTLEGYLFPDTYFFPPKTPVRQVIEEMVSNFAARFFRPHQQEIGRSGKTLHELVTEGSLIEREAEVPQDRPRIAGVLDNRLQRGMRLEIDATVLYALGHHKARVLYKDLKVNSPYNTYRHKGLPPGPIANPGTESLLAALHPERHDYLFYVARPDGSHLFTRTIEAHEAAKRQARAEFRQRNSAREVHPGE